MSIEDVDEIKNFLGRQKNLVVAGLIFDSFSDKEFEYYKNKITSFDGKVNFLRFDKTYDANIKGV